MQIRNFCPLANELAGCVVVLAMAWTGTPAAAQNNTLSGTYTVLYAASYDYLVQFNALGQQVGFCNSTRKLPVGYSCYAFPGQDVFTGTLIANGTGGIVTGSNFVLTRDPNYYQCSSNYNAAPECPYKVPAGIAWSSTASYVVGDEVDATVGGKLLTFQAVTSNTNVAPSTSNTCSASLPPPKCTWSQLYSSATNKGSFKGTMTGTYTIQSNGSGASQLTLTSTNGTQSVSLGLIVPPAPLAVGQEVHLVAQPTLGNDLAGSGTAVRVK